jgi:cytochrome P450 family 709
VRRSFINNFEQNVFTTLQVLRHHPIAALALNRTAAINTTIGGIEVEEGTCVHVDVFSVHFNKEVWGEDAAEFKPERLGVIFNLSY